MTGRTRIVVSRAGAALTVCSLLGAFALTIGDTTTTSGDIPSVIIVTVGILGMASVGALLSSRAPGNPVGPLFQLTSAAFSFAIFVSEYGSRWDTDLSGLPAVPLIVELGNLMIPVVLVSLLSTFLLFPDGHLPSRRWRPIAWLLLASGAVGLLMVSVVSQTNTLDTGTDVENPLALGALSGWTWMAFVWAALLVAAAIPSLASVVVRFRRSHGEERQQIRWLAWASALALFSIAAALVTGIVAGPNGSSTANDVAFTVLIGSITIGLPGACAIAILRYRLYDLDLVIKKAAVFTIVAIVITVVYATALAIAALSFLGSVAAVILFVLNFNPVRRRARKLAERVVYGQRATPFEVLSEFSERVGETYSIDEVLPRMAQLLAASTGATETRVWLRTDRRLVPVAAWPAGLPSMEDRELTGDDLPTFEDVSSFPVTHQGDLLGAITLRLHANDPMDPTKERLVNGLASQAGLALRNVRLVQDLRASRRRIVSAQDERAKRLERDIHDGAQQQLVALAVKLRLADTMVDRNTGAAHELLGQLQTEANDALENLRDLARGIYPPLLADKGLPAALEGQVRKSPVPVVFDANGVGRYTPEIEAAVYFCSLEALNNVAKYASASRVEVRLAHGDGHLTFEVRDDGAGFDTATAARGTGLQGMA
ncbi:MAG: histidine kinase, partial [Actinomycetota bacterium]|nr:histidine kinase [Actinomycetota bacterium]